MTTRPDIDPDHWKGRTDLLSSDEERVLSEVREIVMGMREDGKSADLLSFVEAVGRAGASVADEGDDLFRCKLSGTCFSLRAMPDGLFEISFSHEIT